MKMMMTKRFALVAGIALLALASCGTGAQRDPGLDTLPSLRMIWADYFPMGNIIASFDYSWRPDRVADIGNPEREAILIRHFDILTAEDEMKPDAINARAPSWRWDRVERIMGFAEAHEFRVHGHVLAWHSQSPSWLNIAGGLPAGWTYTSAVPGPHPREHAIANLQEHIEYVMRRLGTRVESWEVLNEIFPSGVGAVVTATTWRNALRNTPWNRAIPFDPATGNCFIWYAFTTARRVADEIDVEAGRPVGTMLLYYNDYNEDRAGKRNAIYYMVREMNERFARENNGRRLIDVIGMQAHYHLEGAGMGGAFGWGPILPSNVRATIERFASLGVYVSITELDLTVGNTDISPITPSQERRQAIVYAQLFNIFRENADVIRRVSIWGIDDPASWRHRGSPLLWGANLRPKEAFWAAAHPDAFIYPDGQPRSNADIDAFLRNPRAVIDARYW
ncbi:MAG: endo-1,4-beta-xylanase [Treponema sp.]|nr:endo-1,4-beta-xylanase [Treponema sp.]